MTLSSAALGSLSESDGNRHGEFQIHPQDIVQHIVSDCSVCAAVTVCVAHRIQMQMRQGRSIEHDHVGIGISLVYAGDGLKQTANTSPDPHTAAHANADLNEKDINDKKAEIYDLKVMFNGAWRRVSDPFALHVYNDLTSFSST